MKLLVFAHTPPPHHGQSYMVELMLKHFGGDQRGVKGGTPSPYGVECYHVNARFSRSLEDIGAFQGTKLLLILYFCLEAIWCRFRYGVTTFYYVPAPGKRVAVYRDWIVLCLCRPFFKKLVLHWHAAGLAKWLETAVQTRTRALTYHWFRQADLSVVISNYNIADAAKLKARRIRVVSNGIPDPCPDFAEAVLPRRLARPAVRRHLLAGTTPEPDVLARAGANPHLIQVLYLAHGSREKGLFAAVEGVRLANLTLIRQASPLRMKLFAAGNFVSQEERAAFETLLADPAYADILEHLGFVAGPQKARFLRESDLFCFPTVYMGENQPVNLIEAMAYGLPIVTTRWRSLPEMFAPGYPGLVHNQAPDQLAAAMLELINHSSGEDFRENFLQRFTLQHHLKNLAGAVRELETVE